MPQREGLALQGKEKRDKVWLWLGVNEETHPGRGSWLCKRGVWELDEPAGVGGGEGAPAVRQELTGVGIARDAEGTLPDGTGAEEGQERRGRRAHAVGRGVLAGEGQHAVTSEGRVRRTDGAFIFLLKSFKPS